MLRGLVAREWESYRRDVLPPNAPDVQVVECRRAFYAGAWALYNLLLTSVGPGGPATTEELDKMRSLDSELRKFKADVLEGRA